MGGVTNVLLLGRLHVGKAGFHGSGNLGGVIHAERGLRDNRQPLRLPWMDACHVGHIFHQVDAAVVQLAHGALHLGVALVADHDELITLFVQLGHFYVDLADQRAGGIKNPEAARLRLQLNSLGHTVCGKNQGSPRWYVIECFNKDSTFFFEVVHHIGVVHNLMAYVDGAAKLLQCALHDLDCPVHTGAKTPRFR